MTEPDQASAAPQTKRQRRRREDRLAENALAVKGAGGKPIGWANGTLSDLRTHAMLDDVHVEHGMIGIRMAGSNGKRFHSQSRFSLGCRIPCASGLKRPPLP